MDPIKQQLKKLSKGTAMAPCPQHGFHFFEVFDIDELATLMQQPNMGLENPKKLFFDGMDPNPPTAAQPGITIIINGDTIIGGGEA